MSAETERLAALEHATSALHIRVVTAEGRIRSMIREDDLTDARFEVVEEDIQNLETRYLPLADASGNGITDDTAVIQAALDYAAALPTGAKVLLPAGIYGYSKTLVIGNNTHVQGEGRGVTR